MDLLVIVQHEGDARAFLFIRSAGSFEVILKDPEKADDEEEDLEPLPLIYHDEQACYLLLQIGMEFVVNRAGCTLAGAMLEDDNDPLPGEDDSAHTISFTTASFEYNGYDFLVIAGSSASSTLEEILNNPEGKKFEALLKRLTPQPKEQIILEINNEDEPEESSPHPLILS